MKKATSLSLKNILVCRTDALGDTLLTLPVALALKKALPQARITFLANPYTAELVAKQSGVDEVLVNAEPKALIPRIASQQFDAALLVFPDRKVSWSVFHAGVGVRVGTGRRLWSILYTHWVRHSRKLAEQHEAEYNLDLVRALGLPADLEWPRLFIPEGDRTWARQYLKTTVKANPGKPLIILHPGSAGSSANWQPEQYGDLAEQIQQKLGAEVLLTGSAKEQGILQQAAKQCTRPPLLLETPVTQLQLAGLIQQATVFVSGNTGPLHLAAALNVPVVGLYPRQGVTGPVRWAPLCHRKIILTPVPSQDPLAVKIIPGEQVLQSVQQLLGAWQGSA